MSMIRRWVRAGMAASLANSGPEALIARSAPRRPRLGWAMTVGCLVRGVRAALTTKTATGAG